MKKRNTSEYYSAKNAKEDSTSKQVLNLILIMTKFI